MSMQSLLASNNCASLLEAIVAGGDYSPALAQAMEQFCTSVVAWRAELLRELRELPDLKRGVKSQQYPMLGEAWPYIRSRHWHYRKHKHSSYAPRPLYCGDGIAVWSQAGKRFAKRTNNKRRRAEDKREIALEMDLWAQDSQASLHLDAGDIMTYFSSGGNYWCSPKGSANVYVPPHPKCFVGHVTYGNVPIRIAQGLNTGNPMTMTPVQLCSEFHNER